MTRCLRKPIADPNDSSVVLIPLTKGQFARVEAADAALVGNRCWYARFNQGVWYAHAKRRACDPSGGHLVCMHEVIWGGKGVDHKNGNGLDNRRSNLRKATPAQNARNRRVVPGVSGFRGVSRMECSRRWFAQIQFQGRQRYLGTFDDRKDAARAYDAAAREFFGEFARLNFPGEGEQGTC